MERELTSFLIKWNNKNLGITYEVYKLYSKRILDINPSKDSYDILSSEQFEKLFEIIYIDKIGIINLNKKLKFMIADFYLINDIFALRNITKSININYNLKLKDWNETIDWIKFQDEKIINELYDMIFTSRLNFNNTLNIDNNRINDLYRYLINIK